MPGPRDENNPDKDKEDKEKTPKIRPVPLDTVPDYTE